VSEYLPVADRYGRRLSTLRIAVTSECNLRCIYCHREGEVYGENRRDEVTLDEMLSIVGVGVELGLNKIKLTGGEPLLRKDIVDLVSSIHSLKDVEEISMTTNGVLLSDYAYELAEAGLKRVNVTVNTLNRSIYEMITGFDLLPRVLDGVEAAIDAGLTPVKINMVLLRGMNEDGVLDLARYAARVGAILQVIELERAGVVDREVYSRLHTPLDRVEELLSGIAIGKYYRGIHSRPRYILPEGAEVELVKPMHNPDFCRYCDRLRVTSRGELKPCLLRHDNHVDVLSALRNGADKEYIKKLFLEAIARRKPYFE
jgi:cyclic pyranopterin phosphate synthase